MGKVLVVDDSHTVRHEIVGYLAGGGHSSLVADNGSVGLNIYKAEVDIDLIITDVNMPVMDGLTMSEEVQKVEGRKAPPIIMVTTESDPELRARGKKAGVCAWVIKPIDGSSFIAAVNQVIERFRSKA